MPDSAQIAKVQANLTNMQAFNDYCHDHGQDKIANAYVLLSQSDDRDRGLADVKNLLEGCFWAMGGELGPVGALGANMLCGLVNRWTTEDPVDMGASYASLITRFDAASVDIDTQLAIYHADPAKYWDESFSYNGQTCTLGDLAGVDFPSEADPEFFTLYNPCIFALDQTIWRMLITTGGFIIAKWEPDTAFPTPFDFAAWEDGFFAAHPSYWATAVYHPDSGGCGDYECYYVTQYNLSTGAGQYHDGHISDAACNYLFADRADGHSYSECTMGLFPRTDVFQTWGLSVHTIYEPYGVASPVVDATTDAARRYLRAKQAGLPTLSALQAEVGDAEIKARLIRAVRTSPSLRSSLRISPLATMERILNVAVPPFVRFSFVFEGPRHFGLVIPWEDMEDTADLDVPSEDAEG